jgi:hypothetical protein
VPSRELGGRRVDVRGGLRVEGGLVVRTVRDGRFDAWSRPATDPCGGVVDQAAATVGRAAATGLSFDAGYTRLRVAVASAVARTGTGRFRPPFAWLARREELGTDRTAGALVLRGVGPPVVTSYGRRLPAIGTAGSALRRRLDRFGAAPPAGSRVLRALARIRGTARGAPRRRLALGLV